MLTGGVSRASGCRGGPKIARMSPGADDLQTMREYARAHPVATTYVPQTLAGIARRTLAGEDLFFCLRAFIDELEWADTAERRAALIRQRPPARPDPRHAAFLGAVAEHVAAVDGQGPPVWSQEPGRFLTRWWFPAEERAFIPLALVESPEVFRRRGIFIAASLLSRVCAPWTSTRSSPACEEWAGEGP